MSQFFRNLRSYSVECAFVGLCVLELIALFMAPRWYSNTSILNTLAFIGVSYLSISQLFGYKHSFLWSILWSVLVTGPLGWFFGIIAVVLYWYLFFKRKPSTASEASEDTDDTQHNRSFSFSDGTEDGTLMVIRPILPIPCVRVRKFWRTYIVRKKGTSYTLVNHLFGNFHKTPTNLTACHRPDMKFLTTLQVVQLDFITIWSCEDNKYIHFFLPHTDGEEFCEEFDNLITEAYNSKGIKRVSSESHPLWGLGKKKDKCKK